MNGVARNARAALLYLGAWLPIAVLFGALLRQTGVASEWRTAFTYAMIYLTPAIALGVPVIMLSRRLVQRSFAWLSWPWLGTHIAAAIAYTLLWHGLYYGYIWYVAGIVTAQEIGAHSWAWQLAQGIFFYGLIAGFTSAVRSNECLREREVAAARSDALRVRAEMQVLRGQLDPHFLFNTLHSITALVRTDPPQAEEALVQFGALLRRVLDWKREGTEEVTLAEEMAFVDDCLALEQLRLGDRLRVERALSPDALACFVPVFAVQPLVENAIRHAVAPQRAGGVLTLSAAVDAGTLTIVVADCGPGAEAAAVAAASGTGLPAIRQRLQLRHGAAGTLTVNTAPGRGFVVTLTLPVVMEPVFNAVA